MQTAMHEDGSINEAELRRQINRQIDAGVDAVFCLSLIHISGAKADFHGDVHGGLL